MLLQDQTAPAGVGAVFTAAAAADVIRGSERPSRADWGSSGVDGQTSANQASSAACGPTGVGAAAANVGVTVDPGTSSDGDWTVGVAELNRKIRASSTTARTPATMSAPGPPAPRFARSLAIQSFRAALSVCRHSRLPTRPSPRGGVRDKG